MKDCISSRILLLKLGSNILYVFSSQIINLLLGVVTSILSAKVLKADGRGEIAIYTGALAIITTWLGLSLNSAVIYFVASKKIREESFFYSSLLYNIFTSLFLFFILTFFRNTHFFSLFLSNTFNSNLWVLVLVFNYFIVQFNGTLGSLMQTKLGFKKVSLFSIFTTLLNLCLLIVLDYYRVNTKISLSIIICFGIVLQLFSSFFYFRYVFNKDYFKLTFLSNTEIKSVLKYIIIVFLCNAIQILSYRIDFWFVKYYHNLSELGVYSLAVTLAQMLWIIPNSIASVFFIKTSQLSDSNEHVVNTVKVIKLYSLVIIPVSIIFFIVIRFLVHKFYDFQFFSSINMLLVLMIGIVPFGITTIIASFFAGRNLVKLNLLTSSISLILSLGLNFIFIPSFGGIGASWATSISYACATIFIVYAFCVKTQNNFTSMLVNKDDVIYFRRIIVEKLALFIKTKKDEKKV